MTAQRQRIINASIDNLLIAVILKTFTLMSIDLGAKSSFDAGV